MGQIYFDTLRQIVGNSIASDLLFNTLEQLHRHLQWAIELEHTTIPAYLYTMYTIMPDTNQEAYSVIQSVVIEELLHMILAANILNAVGGQPCLNYPGFVPEYPRPMPRSANTFQIQLLKFSPEAIGLFLIPGRTGYHAGPSFEFVNLRSDE
jgi:hypothetical protein